MRGGNKCLDCPTIIYTAARTGSVPTLCPPCAISRRNARARALRAARPEVAPRTCEVCGVMFTPYRATDTRGEMLVVTTCSRACFRKSDRGRAVQRDYHHKHRDRVNKRRLEIKYGIDADWYAAAMVAQSGRCAICGDQSRAACRCYRLPARTKECRRMKVRMKVQLSGSRNGAEWPAAGAELMVPDAEGADLCANGMAEPVAVPEPVEKRATTTRKAAK